MILNSVVATAAATITHTHHVMPGSGSTGSCAGSDVAGSGTGVFIGAGSGIGAFIGAGSGTDGDSGAGKAPEAPYCTEPICWDWGKYSVTSNDPMANLTLASITSPNTL